MKVAQARPFLKWAGGKSQLLDQLELNYPQKLMEGKISRYVEPFVGGGAVFFELIKKYEFSEVFLNDINEDLMLCYKVIRDNSDDLIEQLHKLEKKYLSKDLEQKEVMFYEIRDLFNKEKVGFDYYNNSKKCVDLCAKLIFLNKTCFNGLYRLNRKGGYNVPFGKHKNPTICDKENLNNIRKVLQDVVLLAYDFEKLSEYINENTFVYMDPPYRPLNKTSSFNSFQKFPFNDEYQKRLAKWYSQMHNKGALLILSNSDPTNTNSEDLFFEELYKDFTIIKVRASRVINSKGTGRGLIRELLITNEEQLNKRYKIDEEH